VRQRSASRSPRTARAPRSVFALATAASLALAEGCTSPATVESFKKKRQDFVAGATFLPPVSVMGSWLPEGKVDKEPGTFSFTQGLLEAFVPIPQDDDGFLIVGGIAGVRDVHFDGVPGIADDELHRYGVRIGYGRFVNDDLLLQGYWQPSLYSDLDGTLQSDDYRLYYGALLAIYRSSPAWFWKLGVSGNDAADTCVLPLVGFAWSVAGPWSVQVLLPRDATLVYRDDPWILSTGFLLESDEYHVRSPDELGLQHDVHVQELYAHLTVERRLLRHLSLVLRGGSTVAGDWDWSYGSGTEALTGTIEPDVFASAGIHLRF